MITERSNLGRALDYLSRLLDPNSTRIKNEFTQKLTPIQKKLEELGAIVTIDIDNPNPYSQVIELTIPKNKIDEVFPVLQDSQLLTNPENGYSVGFQTEGEDSITINYYSGGYVS